MIYNKKVGAIIQARMTSSRLPGKVLLDLAGKPVLQHIIERLRMSEFVDDVIVATTTNDTDQPIIDLCHSLNCTYFRGSEEDVLSRVLGAAKTNNIDIIVEITADCPCADHTIVDKLLKSLGNGYFDYASNVVQRSFPRGLDTQVFYTHVLEEVDKIATNPADRQHVSTYIYKNPETQGKYKLNNMSLNVSDMAKYRITLDTQEDYEVLKYIFNKFEDNTFNLLDLFNVLIENPDMVSLNSHIQQKDYFKEWLEHKTLFNDRRL